MGDLTAWVSAALLLVVAGVPLYAVQRTQYPNSPHVELPGAAAVARNPWVAAFLWCRENTPASALFVVDAAYMQEPQDDSQTFRAWSLRSVLPDQAKDGGEAAVDPALSAEWQQGASAQAGLNTLSDEVRRARLAPLGVSWIVLKAGAATHLPCPYKNSAVKVCSLAEQH